MDFTTSLDFGSSILANIERAEKKFASAGKTATGTKRKEVGSEVIDESPTNKSTKTGKSSKENSKDSLTQSRYRRRALRKNKSDSVLQSKQEPAVKNGNTQKENFSDFFNTPMEFGVFSVEKKVNDAVNANLAEPDKSSNLNRQSPEAEQKELNNLDDMFAESMDFSEQIRFSLKDSPPKKESVINIEDSSFSFRDLDCSEDMVLEKALCNSDLKELGLEFCSESPTVERSTKVAMDPLANGENLHVKELSFMLANQDVANLIVDMSSEMILEEDVKRAPTRNRNTTAAGINRILSQNLTIETEEIINIEETSFIAPVKQSAEKDATAKQEDSLMPSKKEILSVLKSEDVSLKPSQFPVMQASLAKIDSPKDLNLSKCSGPVLNWSLSTDPEETPKKDRLQAENKKESNPPNTHTTALKDIANWNLPPSIIKEYHSKGIRQMFDWQVECLSNPKVLFDHSNLVYSAPTSAGKTLVSEILTLKTVIERKKKALIILPFISVVREKMCYLQDLLTSSGYRVDGFFGGYTPPGGFDNINIAICTIEKANSIINKLLEQNKLDCIGMIVVDEIHLISDPGRGYILELLLAKVTYMCRKNSLKIQVVAMSATLSNIILLQKWLQAEFYVTNFRPVELQEMIKVGTKIYNNKMDLIRELKPEESARFSKDQDHIAQLCIETILIECSVIVFCPSKDWCETLCMHLAGSIFNSIKFGDSISEKLGAQVKKSELEEVKMQLKNCPAGLDSVLSKTVPYGCAFHHAGLTSEERDIIESNFKSGALKILAATSTLSSGVNLPARRVIIRSPLFAGKKMNPLTYKQMIGRAGRTGKDTLGESILICTEANCKAGKELVCSELLPIQSCLSLESSMPLKRALLEVLSSGIANTKDDVHNFLECTLLHIQNSHDSKLDKEKDPLNDSLQFLIEYEFIRLQMNEETKEMNYVPTRLGMACLSSSLPPNDGLLLFSELQKSRRCFVLETELHAVYLVTPYSVCYQLQEIDWLLYLDLHERLSSSMKRVAELVGVKESFLVKAMRGHTKLDYKTLQIHKRFYTALALQELVNEVPLNAVSEKYKCSRGLLQSLQQMSSTFAGIVTSFCNALNWTMLALIVSEFKERLFFGVHRDLIDLMRIPDLNAQKARALFNAGITSLVDLANADCFTVEKILFNSVSFDSEKKHDEENEYDANKRKVLRCLYITGKIGLTIKDIAKLLISNARQYLQHEIGVEGVKWSNNDKTEGIIDSSDGEIRNSSTLENNKQIVASNSNCQELSNHKANNETHEEQAVNAGSLKNEDGLTIASHATNKETESPFNTKPARRSKQLSNINLRRSPRNHASASESRSKLETVPKAEVEASKNAKSTTDCKTEPRVSDIFNDSTLDLNSQIEGALGNGQHPNNPVAKCAKPSENKASPAQSSPINKSVEEIVESQTPKTPKSLRGNSTRMLRSRLTQKRLISKAKKQIEGDKKNNFNGIEPKSNKSSSIEISDCASSSLLNNPLHLNSSHILSTSKTEPSSALFNCISILDICGNCALFKKAIDELTNAKHIGLSVSVQKLRHKKRPMIGANLLLNQIQTNKEDDDADFVFDDAFYMTGVSMCTVDNVVFYMNFQNKENENKINRLERVTKIIELLQSDKLTFRIFDAKEQLKALRKCLPELKTIKARIEDPKIASWLLEPDKEMSLKKIVQQYAPECSALMSLCGTCHSNNSVGMNYASSIVGRVRSAIESCVSLHVLEGQLENLERIANGNLEKFYHELEMPVQISLWKMEVIGFPVNEVALGNLSKHILEVMKKLERKMYELHGSRFNLSSTSAVARVLGLHKKPNGRVSTAKQILEKIDSPMSNLILNYRKLGATLNKTIQPLIQNAKNGRIHGSSITFTATGRISMHEPNLQCVAKDFTVDIEGGDSIPISCRSSFSSSDGISLISVDFCQLEMRILTHLSNDSILMKIMQSNDDIFRGIAAQWNKIPLNEVSEQLRNGTKQICYGIIYGMGIKSLAESLKCEIDDATSLLEQFHIAYPGIRQYTNKVVKFAKQNGYVETITGRRRYLPHITSTDETLKGQAERQALNTTIQGSAADIAKKAIIRTERNLEKYRSRMGLDADDVKFVLHLHDELLFEVPEHKVQKVAKVLRISMENSAQLNIPLRVKLKAGKSWGTLQEI
ncbi:DNA polymerase theta [Hermetia illucens]|uniref:DNA polymerase theta n=1 Tax=Hermetia illucens TaxID=343691 RepID=UPI0018CC41F2|nr:DNA polymerase theta [Hermetia illucens]